MWIGVLLQAALAGASAPQPTGSVVEAVVFPDRALVTRHLAVDLQLGVNAVVFRDLPPTLDPLTLTAVASGLPGSVLVGLDTSRVELAEDRRAHVAALQASAEALRDQRVRLQDRASAADFELGFLGSVKGAAASQLSAELLFAPETAAKVSALAALLRGRVPQLQEAKLAAAVELRALDARLAALMREIAEVEGAAQWARYQVTVLVESPGAGAGSVRLSYALPGASWEPVYDLRADPSKNKVELILSAMVRQRTGESWEGASLTLSTARPARGLTPPALQPHWLDRPVVVTRWADAEESSVSFKMADEMVLAEPPAEPMAVAVAEATQSGTVTTFAVPGKTSLDGEGVQRKLRVAEVGLDVDFRRVIVPRIDPTAWLVGEAVWTQSWPILPGQSSVFLGETYVGQSSLEGAGLGGTLRMGFGADDAVEVKAERLTDLHRPPDWLGMRTWEETWRYSLISHGDAPVSVELLDRFPVSRDARYRVKRLGDLPEEVSPDGLATWKITLDPNVSVERSVGVRVRYPRRAGLGGQP